MLIKPLQEQFAALYRTQPIIARAPGRINIIGEHTDYNGGFVLPAAIDLACYIAIDKRTDAEVHLFSVKYQEHYTVLLNELVPLGKWPDYITGVVHELHNRGYKITGFNAVMDSNVPIGAGISSSAAIECAVVKALDHLFGLKLTDREMAAIAQKAEHVFAGVQCGIMDQFASIFGKKDHAVKLDCRSLEYEYIQLQPDGFQIVLFNSNVHHSLASTAYNTRREECREGVRLLQKKYPQVNTLRDVTISMLSAITDPVIHKRCRFVLEENERLHKACNALQQGNTSLLGSLLYNSHNGLQYDYEVSCPELDFLVKQVKDQPGVMGARMMGGGFGGCTINIVKEDAVDEVVNRLSKAYQQETGLHLSVYFCRTADGASIVQANGTILLS